MTSPISAPTSANTATEPGKGNYHHGELRELLMGLALARIAIDGTEKFSLRALAREANVSATAPFRHFTNKHALFAALATEGFQQLGERVSAVARTSQSVDQRLLACSLRFGFIGVLWSFGDEIFSTVKELRAWVVGHRSG